MTRESKYMQVVRVVEDQINSGALTLGLPLPPIRTLMEKYGFSLATINKALEILEKRGRVIRMHGKGVFVCEPGGGGDVALHERSGSKPIQIMAICDWRGRPEAPTMWWTRILRGIESALAPPRGGQLRLCGPSDFRTPQDLVSGMRRMGIDSLINLGDHWQGATLTGMARAVREAGAGMVMLWSGQPKPWPTHSVDVDNRAGIISVVEHLAGLGHRRLGFVGYDAAFAWVALRRQAFREAVELFGLEAVEHLLPWGKRALWAQQLGALANSETAFVCANDDIAAHLVGVLRGKGIAVPEAVSVTGFDDDYLHRPFELTTVRADLERIGRDAVDLLVKVRQGEWSDRTCHIQMLAPLVIRHTTGVRPLSPVAAPEGR